MALVKEHNDSSRCLLATQAAEGQTLWSYLAGTEDKSTCRRLTQPVSSGSQTFCVIYTDTHGTHMFLSFSLPPAPRAWYIVRGQEEKYIHENANHNAVPQVLSSHVHFRELSLCETLAFLFPSVA